MSPKTSGLAAKAGFNLFFIISLLLCSCNAFPRFAERGEGGGYQQQDANECWMEILRMLQVKLGGVFLQKLYFCTNPQHTYGMGGVQNIKVNFNLTDSIHIENLLTDRAVSLFE